MQRRYDRFRLGLVLTFIALGCGGGGGVDAGPAPDAAGPPSGRDYRAELEAPPAIAAHLLDLADALAEDLCAFSATCCTHYGYLPHKRCARIADATVLAVELGDFVDQGRQLAIDEAWSARCRELVQAHRTDCVHDIGGPPWEAACRNVVRVFERDGSDPGECAWDQDCVLLRGVGYGCRDGACVALDCAAEPCGRAGDACSSDRECSEGRLCGAGPTCAERTGARYGEACADHAQCPLSFGEECQAGVCRDIGFEDRFCSPITIEDIAPTTPLTVLDEAQLEGLCVWASEVFARIECNGVPIATSGCQAPASAACTANIGQYMACWSRFAAEVDGCALAAVASVEALAALLQRTPGCDALIPCVERMR